jgi:hypothetical protein
MPKAAAPAQLTAQQIAQINANQSYAVRQSALDMDLRIMNTAYSPPGGSGALGSVINVPLRNVGLVKKLTVVIRGNIKQSGTETLTLTPMGPANFLSQVTLTDLQNQTRVNTTGWHLHLLASARSMGAFGAAYTSDTPTGIGNNFNVVKAPGSVTTVQPFFMVYEIPLAYSNDDLRGAIYANVLNATWNLALTINPNLVVASGADPTLAMYRSSSAVLGVLQDYNIEVYQHFLDQLPVDGSGAVIVPQLDLSTMYKIENTLSSGIVAGQDNAIPYANFRQFLSTILIYDNNGLNAGTDINYIGLQTANTTNLFSRSVQMMALQSRKILGDDMPPGVYYFDHRARPIQTANFGNMQLIVNPSNVANAQAAILVGYEYFANMNVITQAGSLYNT